MATFKLVIANPKTGNSFQKEAKDDAAKHFLGLKIGDVVKGETIDMTGYEFEITGGSDNCGFPMRKDVQGMGRKKILIVTGTGKRAFYKGVRERKTVCGNTIHDKTAQINLKVVKQGAAPLAENDVPKQKKVKGAKKEESKKEGEQA